MDAVRRIASGPRNRTTASVQRPAPNSRRTTSTEPRPSEAWFSRLARNAKTVSREAGISLDAAISRQAPEVSVTAIVRSMVAAGVALVVGPRRALPAAVGVVSGQRSYAARGRRKSGLPADDKSAGSAHDLRVSKLAATLLLAGATVVAGCGDSSSNENGTPAAPVAAARGTTSLQQQFVGIVKAVSPSVVQIQTPRALGSGVVFDTRGDVVTNAHVVGTSTRFVVTVAAGDSHPAAIVGRDAAHDLAVIRIAGARPRPATFADSSRVQVGDVALALGNPLGLRSSVTQGIVSAVGRTVSEGNGVTLSSTIQTSAEINPGNSGGALVDLSGRVIGIPTLAALDPQMGSGEAAGIGFAIDSDTVRRVAGGLTGPLAVRVRRTP